MQEPFKMPVVMVADDDPITVRVVAAELEAAGFQAVACPDGIAALTHLALGERLDVLVTDVHMPGSVDGRFLAVEARIQRPRLPVVYVSGRPVEAKSMVPGSRFLEKPYVKGHLAALVRTLMCSAVTELMAQTWALRPEIERKFLVKNDTWQRHAVGSRRLSDCVLEAAGGMKVRVRKDGVRAWLTVKGPRTGIRRMEFECEISLRQADALLATVLDDGRLEKVSHSIPDGGLTWTVDVYEGELEGVVIAEVELDGDGQDVTPPAWVGPEVTDDPRFGQRALRDLRDMRLRTV